jgi:WhiB family transcriptional regulator, redox-sensing transcriptional regulator
MAATLAPWQRPAENFVPVCTADPERWTTTDPDDEAKALCLACPRRWLCAREACQLPGVEGLWAGVVVPESGRPRDFAMRQLRSLAEHGGHSVRRRRRPRRRIACSNGLDGWNAR